jgi:NAD(P)-dependent dehydrogenase (short-subunit alcohol dehydrogenase family)
MLGGGPGLARDKELPMEIEGKVTIVSGGASGIGRAAVLALVDLGAKVVVTDADEEGGCERHLP